MEVRETVVDVVRLDVLLVLVELRVTLDEVVRLEVTLRVDVVRVMLLDVDVTTESNRQSPATVPLSPTPPYI